jgi:hypothetical protein
MHVRGLEYLGNLSRAGIRNHKVVAGLPDFGMGTIFWSKSHVEHAQQNASFYWKGPPHAPAQRMVTYL